MSRYQMEREKQRTKAEIYLAFCMLDIYIPFVAN